MDIDETINIIGDYYNKDLTSDQVSKLIVEIAENQCFEEKKKKIIYIVNKELLNMMTYHLLLFI